MQGEDKVSLPNPVLANLRSQHCRCSWPLDQCRRDWRLWLSHDDSLPLLHSRRHRFHLERSPAICAGLCTGSWPRWGDIHDHPRNIGLSHGKSTLVNQSVRIYAALQNTSIAIVAASRLIFAVARDGVLPLSGWIGTVTQDGQPRNAVRVMLVFGAVLLCVILPSNVAFTSLISAGGVPTIAAYGLIGLLRLTMTPKGFRSSKYHLGKVAPLLYLVVVVYQGIVFAVCS